MKKRKILFFSEAVSTSHLTRPWNLARNLDPEKYEVYFASSKDPRDPKAIATNELKWIQLKDSVTPEAFQESVSKGNFPYTKAVLEQQVKEDLAVIKSLNPDVVIGDFRLSLGISCPSLKVPFISLTNMVWSPFSKATNPVPEHFIVERFGLSIAKIIFMIGRPLFLRNALRPFNKLRKYYGLKPFDNFLDVHTSGDLVLYMDPAGLFAQDRLPKHHQLIGPVSAIEKSSPITNLENSNKNVQNIFVCLGSTGPSHHLPMIIKSLGHMPVNVIVSTGGVQLDVQCPKNVRIMDYVSTQNILPNMDLIISNGGSPTNYDALKFGVPNLMIPTNLDQYVNAQAIVDQGAGLLLRCGNLTKKNLVISVRSLLQKSKFKENALMLKNILDKENSNVKFQSQLNLLLDDGDRMRSLRRPGKFRSRIFRKLTRALVDLLPKSHRSHIYRRSISIDPCNQEKIQMKLAETKEELSAAFRLLHDNYVESGYMDPLESKLRISEFNAIPSTSVLIAVKNKEVIATVSLVRDGALGLPIDSCFDISNLRSRGRVLAEVSSLCVDKRYRDLRNKVSLSIMNFLRRYAVDYFGVDTFVIGVHPRTRDFYEAIFGFNAITEPNQKSKSPKVQPVDYVKGSPAMGMFLDVDKEKYYPLLKSLYRWAAPDKDVFKYYFETKLVNATFPTRPFVTASDPVMSEELLRHFFNHKTSVFAELSDKKKIALIQSYSHTPLLKALPKLSSNLHVINQRKEIRHFVGGTGNMQLNGRQKIVVLDVAKHGCMIQLKGEVEPPQSVQATVKIDENQTVLLNLKLVWKNESGRCAFQIEKPNFTWLKYIDSLTNRLVGLTDERKISKAS